MTDPLLPVFDVIRDAFDERQTRIEELHSGIKGRNYKIDELTAENEALRESKESLEMDLEHAEREVELLKAKVEELAPSVYGEAA